MSTSCTGPLGPVSMGLQVRPEVRGYRACDVGSVVSTSSPGRLGPGSECLRGQAAVPCDLGRGARARGVDQLSRGTRARVQGTARSNSCPGRLWPGSEGLQCRLTLLTTLAQVRWPTGSTSCPRHLGTGYKGPRCGPAFSGESCLGPRARGVHLLSWATRVFDQPSRVIRAQIRGPTESTSCPG